jgi:ribosomal protein L20A (L18A)
MKYEVKGTVQLGRMTHVFAKEVEAVNEERAKMLLLSDFGGKYRINSRKIKIEEVVKKEDLSKEEPKAKEEK